jgi:metal-sulfur cluster biosynthetic enzyme
MTDLAPSTEEAALDALTGGEPSFEQTMSDEEEQILEALRDVVDPELGINVVDLGLIYGVTLSEDEGKKTITLDMTLTSAACPLTDVIEDQANSATADLADELKINWVWLPPWGPDKITDEGREQLQMLGTSSF